MSWIPLALLGLAASSEPSTYALFVGASEGGAGQQRLLHAKDDVAVMAGVLREVGRLGEEQRLLDPSPTQVLSAIERARAHLARAQGDTMFVFYYSGHARADAIELGGESLSLDVLRRELDAVPATLRVIILDACQSGAYSAVKGALPAAQFTVRSTARLASEGSAVMASSTGSELSQESPELGGSFFTHHLAVGLRGAADADRDGRVSLRESYDYAYNRTLLSTAMTAVGRQHPVLETRLKGTGDVILSYPAEADAHLAIADASAVVSTAAGTVVAEVFAPPGERVTLALPPGEYVAITRRGEDRQRCAATLTKGVTTRLETGACSREEPLTVRAKGGGYGWDEGWGLELGTGFRFGADDDYTDRLAAFGYQDESGLGDGVRAQLSVTRAIADPFEAVLGVGLLDRGEYTRRSPRADGTEIEQRYTYGVWSATLSARAYLEIGLGFSVFAQAGGGVAFGSSTFVGAEGVSLSELGVGPVLGVGGGLRLRLTSWMQLQAQLGYSTATALANRAGDTHQSGGLENLVGLRVEL